MRGWGGHGKIWDSFNTGTCSFSNIEVKGGPKKYLPFKKKGGGGVQNVLPCLEGDAPSFGPAMFPVAPPHPTFYRVEGFKGGYKL